MSPTPPFFIRRLLLAVLALATAVPPCAAGELDEARRSVRRKRDKPTTTDYEPPPPADERACCSLFGDEEDEDGLDCELSQMFGMIIGGGLVITTTAPFWGPRQLLGDTGGVRATFPAAPYSGGYDGFLITGDRSHRVGHPWTANVAAEYGTNFDSLARVGTRFQVDTTWRIGLEGQWDHWFEEGPTSTSELDIGDVNLVCRFAHGDKVQFHAGLGMNWLHDAVGTDTGLNFTYGADFYPRDPFVLSAVMDFGTIGSATVLRLRGTVGAQIDRVETYIGYEHQRIGDAELNGLVAGALVTF